MHATVRADLNARGHNDLPGMPAGIGEIAGIAATRGDLPRIYFIEFRQFHTQTPTFHRLAPSISALHVSELSFRYNDRFNDDIFGTAIEGC